ncbi:MAG: hypothetical protein OEZ58_23365, partial [Gammaproteobacteria bacterium]|nr:hypothetical protein [Gammaproteobacteria bacterium]
SKQDYVSYVFAQGDTISVEHRDLMNRILSDAGFNPKKGDAAVRGFLTGAKSNSDNTLSLGKNSRYKADIEFAAKRTGLTKATIAALINAEAAKDKNGVWDPNSKNTRASATGLTQFISLTWEYEATNENTYLNQRAKELGYIDKSNNIVNKQGLLDLRKNSRESIVAAAEMGKRNLDNLVKAGLLDAESNEKTLAQVMYLTHQSGYTGAKRYLNKTDKANEPILTQETAKYLLAKQIGAKQANTNINIKRGNAPLAYREWLQGHMDKFVNPSKFK